MAPWLLWMKPADGKRPLQRNDLSHSLVAFDQNSAIAAVVELSLENWLVRGLVPGVHRAPLKKRTADPARLLALLERWRHEAIKAGHAISRIVVAFEAGRDGFWLARYGGLTGPGLAPGRVERPGKKRSA